MTTTKWFTKSASVYISKVELNDCKVGMNISIHKINW